MRVTRCAFERIPPPHPLPYQGRGDHQRRLQFPVQTVERVVPNTLTGPNANRLGTIGSTFCLLRFHPVWLALFVKGGDAFVRFVRLTRLHVIFQSKIDVSLHGVPPKVLY